MNILKIPNKVVCDFARRNTDSEVPHEDEEQKHLSG